LRNARLNLEDIAEAVAGIEQTLAGADLESFARSWQMRRAVERGLEIISEASRRIPDEWKSARPDVPWVQIAGIGNILRHEYHRVEAAIVWNIAHTHLPALAGAVRAMLSDGGSDR
jgi:uncharacterized protein with HEPN domain